MEYTNHLTIHNTKNSEFIINTPFHNYATFKWNFIVYKYIDKDV